MLVGLPKVLVTRTIGEAANVMSYVSLFSRTLSLTTRTVNGLVKLEPEFVTGKLKVVGVWPIQEAGLAPLMLPPIAISGAW